MKLVRFKINGQYIYGQQMTPEAKKLHRREYNKQWREANPEKVQANMQRHLEHKEKVRLGL